MHRGTYSWGLTRARTGFIQGEQLNRAYRGPLLFVSHDVGFSPAI